MLAAMVCSTFSISGWSVVRSAMLAKGDTLEKRPSLHLHKVLTWSKKLSPQTSQMALICNFLHSSVIYPVLGINIILKTLILNTLNLR